MNKQYVHNETGDVYTLLFYTNVEADRGEWEPQAVYVGTDGRVWSRPARTFHARFTEIK